MRHTIVSWDCSYRNFFHLIDGLLDQDYPRDEFELIYVEQRKKSIANEYNHNIGLKSLEDRFLEVQNNMNIKVLYLDDPLDKPYHLGKCNNAGIKGARGEIISVMDGDQLLPRSFLNKLDLYHKNHPSSVVNVHRKMCQYPVGVDSFKKWTDAKVDLKSCLRACKNPYAHNLPKKAPNKGPLISAERVYWDKTKGYDEHPMWGGSLSKLGKDMTVRLEIASGHESVALPNSFTVHPWHPKGSGVLRSNKLATRHFSLQNRLTRWSLKNNEPDWTKRKKITETTYSNNKQAIKRLFNKSLHQKIKGHYPNKNIFFKKTITKYQRVVAFISLVYRKYVLKKLINLEKWSSRI